MLPFVVSVCIGVKCELYSTMHSMIAVHRLYWFFYVPLSCDR